jgi:mono/diheme cytochrome c family protein
MSMSISMTPNARRLVAKVFLFIAFALSASGIASTKKMTLPPDGVQLEASGLPGYAKARAVCATCHSAEYMLYQPPTAPRSYWDAMVKRMKTVFNAPVDDADMPDIVDYLTNTYGAERARN